MKKTASKLDRFWFHVLFPQLNRFPDQSALAFFPLNSTALAISSFHDFFFSLFTCKSISLAVGLASVIRIATSR